MPGGDHVPYYYAKKMGWYKEAGIDLNIEPGKGSAVAVQKVGAGANPIGLADMPNALTLRGKGADTVGVFNVYANSPQGLYWLKSSGIKSVKDLAGKKIGNPAGDGARTIWPALAKANGMDPASVTWVNIDANAKLASLKSKAIDATTSFYNIHHIFQRELGDDMGFVAWKDAGPQHLRQHHHRQRRLAEEEQAGGRRLRQGHAEGVRRLRQDAGARACRR